MDGSFLSQQEVVTASREFVCIRLATYEDQAETRFLSKIYRGRTGNLENTVFAMLTPDGKDFLVRPGRGPHFAFRDATDMAKFMRDTAGDYPQTKTGTPPLPVVARLDVALNVAACDGLPVAIRVHPPQAKATTFDVELNDTVWDTDLAGEFVFAKATPAELKPISGVQIEEGLLIVEPDEFGTSAEAVHQIDVRADRATIEQALRQTIAKRAAPVKNPQQHIRTGVQLGIDWETAVPVTDSMSLRAKRRFRDDE